MSLLFSLFTFFIKQYYTTFCRCIMSIFCNFSVYEGKYSAKMGAKVSVIYMTKLVAATIAI